MRSDTPFCRPGRILALVCCLAWHTASAQQADVPGTATPDPDPAEASTVNDAADDANGSAADSRSTPTSFTPSEQIRPSDALPLRVDLVAPALRGSASSRMRSVHSASPPSTRSSMIFDSVMAISASWSTSPSKSGSSR